MVSFRFTRSPSNFPIMNQSLSANDEYSFKIRKFALHIKRVRLYPNAQASIIKTLENHPAKYYITKSDTQKLTISQGLSSISIENVFKRCFIGFVGDKAVSGKIDSDPFYFKNFNVNHISLNIDEVMYPCIPYTPEFEKGNCMREFIELFRVTRQDEGIAQIQLSYAK